MKSGSAKNAKSLSNVLNAIPVSARIIIAWLTARLAKHATVGHADTTRSDANCVEWVALRIAFAKSKSPRPNEQGTRDG